ncbi:MAG: hypothetical protein ACRCXT_14145 [Paraclostridium sp.]
MKIRLIPLMLIIGTLSYAKFEKQFGYKVTHQKENSVVVENIKLNNLIEITNTNEKLSEQVDKMESAVDKIYHIDRHMAIMKVTIYDFTSYWVKYRDGSEIIDILFQNKNELQNSINYLKANDKMNVFAEIKLTKFILEEQ